MQRWEIKNHWIPIDVQTDSNTQGDYKALRFFPQWQECFKKAWAEAEKFAGDGWELVSLAPTDNGYVCYWVPEPNKNNIIDPGRLGQSFGYGCSYTAGYLLVFKRPKS